MEKCIRFSQIPSVDSDVQGNMDHPPAVNKEDEKRRFKGIDVV